jgi:galactokinase
MIVSMTDPEHLKARFRSFFGGAPQLVEAPGRVNLIGEHTDYNDGFVLPAALDLVTRAIAAPRGDRLIRARSLLMDEAVEFSLDDPAPRPRGDWSDYVRGVAIMLERAGWRVSGIDLLIDSNVPLGAGLSSSAALEVATGYALLTVSEADIDLTRLALACQRAENEFVGARCGIMDQFIACHGKVERALLIDCRTLEGRDVPIDAGIRLVISNTMVRHEIAAGEYNLRRRECEDGVRGLAAALPGITALRDVSTGELEAHADLLDPLVYRRCRHVVTENERTHRAAAALKAGDFALVGNLMRQSQTSMRDDFEISCREVDLMIELNEKADGVVGARMTGGGFGGCTISLVVADAVDAFRENVMARYKAATGLDAQIFVCVPGPGVRTAEEA